MEKLSIEIVCAFFRQAATTGASRAISTSGATVFASGLDDAAPRSRTSAPPSISARACASAAPGARYFPPSENESSVMFRMPRIFMDRAHANKKGGRSLPLYTPSEDLSSRLRLGRDRRDAGAAAAGGGYAGSWAALRLGLFIRFAHRGNALEQRDDLVARQRLVFEQAQRQHMQVAGPLDEDFLRPAVAVVDDALDFLVDALRGRLGNILRARHAVAEENLFLVLGIGDRPQQVGHPVARDHRARHAGRHLDVAGGAGGDFLVAEDQLLGNAPAEGDAQIGQHLLARQRKLVAFGQAHHHAERAAARNDRGLVNRIGGDHRERHDGVAAFVIGGEFLFSFRHRHGAPLGPHHHFILGILEFGHGDDAPAAARREQCRLVDEIGEIGAREAGRAARDGARVDVGRQRNLAHVHAQDLLAAREIGIGNHDMAIETARAQQRGIEHVGTVGGGDQDDAFVGFKAVISTSNWLSVCSRSSLPPPRPAPRWRPTASISSMKTMQGAFFLACSNMSRTRLAPTPTNISTKSDPEIVKNGTLASPRMARARSVLAVAGGPTSRTPRGIRPPSRWNFCGSRKNSTISCRSSLASSTPATSSNVTRPCASVSNFALDLPKPMALPP